MGWNEGMRSAVAIGDDACCREGTDRKEDTRLNWRITSSARRVTLDAKRQYDFAGPFEEQPLPLERELASR